MTGLPKSVLDRIALPSCGHCWHSLGIVDSRCRQYICCWCGKTEWFKELGLKSVPGHGAHYPLPWTWTG